MCPFVSVEVSYSKCYLKSAQSQFSTYNAKVYDLGINLTYKYTITNMGINLWNKFLNKRDLIKIEIPN